MTQNRTQTTAKNIRPLPNLSAEYVQSVFGTNSPTLEQRTEHFFELWRHWWATGIFVKPNSNMHDARRILNELGLVEFRDFQIRFQQIRFSDQTHLALASMSGLQTYISHRTQED